MFLPRDDPNWTDRALDVRKKIEKAVQGGDLHLHSLPVRVGYVKEEGLRSFFPEGYCHPTDPTHIRVGPLIEWAVDRVPFSTDLQQALGICHEGRVREDPLRLHSAVQVVRLFSPDMHPKDLERHPVIVPFLCEGEYGGRSSFADCIRPVKTNQPVPKIYDPSRLLPNLKRLKIAIETVVSTAKEIQCFEDQKTKDLLLLYLEQCKSKLLKNIALKWMG